MQGSFARLFSPACRALFGYLHVAHGVGHHVTLRDHDGVFGQVLQTLLAELRDVRVVALVHLLVIQRDLGEQEIRLD